MDYYDDFEVLGDRDYDADDYYDIYQMPADQSNEEHLLKPAMFSTAFSTCIQPSLRQGAGYVVTLIGWNVLWHLLAIICATVGVRQKPPVHRAGDGEGSLEWLQHFASFVCGMGLLYTGLSIDFLIVVFLCLATYAVLIILQCNRNYHNRMGITMALLTISAHFIYEIVWHQPEAWQRIRGVQMVASMKIISLSFDLQVKRDETTGAAKKNMEENTTTPVLSLLSYLGYLFCPATCLLGPWLPYDRYLQTLRQWRSENMIRRGLHCLLNCTLNIMGAMLFLCCSNCIVPLMCRNNSGLWIRTYRDALTVRCSHYFICLLSQAAMAGEGVHDADEYKSFYWVTKPWKIEWPRSLHSLVRSWNIPMHEWLKKYVFRIIQENTIIIRGRYFIALFGTYMVSSLLHGLHVRIYAVLLSLACCAYVDVVLRRKLAQIFDACITATPCKPPCPFKYCPTRMAWRTCGAILIRIINIGFSILTICQLAYLGVMMDDSDRMENTDEKESNRMSMIMEDVHRVIHKWSQLGFFCHWLMLASYIFYLSI